MKYNPAIFMESYVVTKINAYLIVKIKKVNIIKYRIKRFFKNYNREK